MIHLKKHFREKVTQREKDGNYRNLTTPNNLVDFYSNDYLGFARNKELADQILLTYTSYNSHVHGSTGSRLISGNSEYITTLEQQIANFHETESSLIFNSGFAANTGLLSCLATKEVTFVYDELSHASIIDGIRLGFAKRFKYKHNNLEDLEKKLNTCSGIVFVVTESVFSMDGDMAPLQEILSLCEKYDAQLIVDEAHAFGIFGKNGSGLINELNLTGKIFAGIYTYGKALGCHGAAVVGSKDLINYLVNFSRPFIYTTAPSLSQLFPIKCGYEKLLLEDFTSVLKQKNQIFSKKLSDLNLNTNPSPSCIHNIVVGDNSEALEIASQLFKAGINVKAILAPTVPVGTERIRLSYHIFNTSEEEDLLFDTLKNIRKK